MDHRKYLPRQKCPVLDSYSRNVPAAKDAFGSHIRIASAVATAIHTDKDFEKLSACWAHGAAANLL